MMKIIKPHVSLNVTDIDASVAFYEKAFGVAATKRRPDYAKFDLNEPALNLTMVQAPRTGLNASHFGIQVADTDDVAAARSRFVAAGLATRDEENTTCCYAVQDKVWIQDPDGNEWEIFVVKGDADSMYCDTSTGGCVPEATAATQATAATEPPQRSCAPKSGCC